MQVSVPVADAINSSVITELCLQCSDTVSWATGRPSGLQKLSDEVLVWLSVWSEVQIACIWSSRCHCIPKPHNLLPHLNPDWFYLSGTGIHRLCWRRSLNGCSSSSSSSHRTVQRAVSCKQQSHQPMQLTDQLRLQRRQRK